MPEEKSNANTEIEQEERAKPAEEQRGSPEYMTTYGDMMTLLLCFFVILFAISSTQEESFKVLVYSLQSALGTAKVPEGGMKHGVLTPNMRGEAEQANAVIGGMVQEEINEIISEIREVILFNKLTGMVSLEETEEGLVIRISDYILFEEGKSKLGEEGKMVLNMILPIILEKAYKMTVAGHTDNVPVNNQTFIKSNWELSAMRAISVVKYFTQKGYSPFLISAEAFGEYHAIATNETPEGRAKNRRVEIIYLKSNITGQLQDKRFR